MKVSKEDILEARQRLAKIIQRTHVDQSISASQLVGADLFFKFENTQRTGSFKIRGAFNKIAVLTESEKARGVVASSAGNHAQGVALSASLAGVKATIVMPQTAPLAKVTATQSYGAEVILHGEIYDEAFDKAQELVRNRNLVFIPPYEDPHVIAGQGTIGLELLEQLPDLDTVIIPVGGGGLISGVALALKSFNPQIRVIGVQSEQAPGMVELFKGIVPNPNRKKISTIADGIAIKNPSKIMYDSFISKYVDEMVTVSEDEIAESIVYLIERLKTVTEGSGAAGFAAVMNGKVKLGKKNLILLCGGNIDLNMVAKVIERGQIKRGRLVPLSVIVEDVPGKLSQITQILAEQKANILQVHHDRVSAGLYLRETKIEFELETISAEHVEKIKKAILKTGARLV
ncbi:MAG: threonine ammonia-lyase [Bdellovibrionales bacterium]